jgi:hypothetical protein
VQGVLFDLGVSSLQLDRAERGFAYSKDAPLDMRMDVTSGRTAADVIAESSEDELRRIFQEYGEEKLAARYARAIVRARAEAPITRSGELVAIITAATPVAVQRQGHPAKRVFQALRIEVNEELSVLAGGDARRARHGRRRRPDRRAGLPVARGPDRQARPPGGRPAPRRPPDSRWSCPSTGRSSGSSCGAPNWRARPSRRRTRVRSRCGCVPPSA